MKFPISICLLVTVASARIFYAGVAESSGEFGAYGTPGTGLPGEFGTTYAFIDEAGVDVYVEENKVNLFRVAFLLERMCPLEYGLGSRLNETHFYFFKQAIDYITVDKGAYAILDPHNYMRYNDPSSQPFSGSVIGNTSDPTAATLQQFADFWGELAGRFVDNEKVIFGLMNEPHDMATQLVLDLNQAAIDSIRNTGARQMIIAPGNGWTGGHAWEETYVGTDGFSNADLMWQLRDPLNNTAFDIHEYLDENFSGSQPECVQRGPENLEFLTGWLKEHGFKAMITEFGGAPNEQCLSYIDEMLDYMANNDVWIGWTAWAAGPFWGPNSPCCTNQTQLGSLEPGSTGADGSPGLYDTVWLPAIQPNVPFYLVWEGLGPMARGDSWLAVV